MKLRVAVHSLKISSSSKATSRPAEISVVPTIQPVTGPTMNTNIWNSMPLNTCARTRRPTRALRTRTKAPNRLRKSPYTSTTGRSTPYSSVVVASAGAAPAPVGCTMPASSRNIGRSAPSPRAAASRFLISSLTCEICRAFRYRNMSRKMTIPASQT